MKPILINYKVGDDPIDTLEDAIAKYGESRSFIVLPRSLIYRFNQLDKRKGKTSWTKPN